MTTRASAADRPSRTRANRDGSPPGRPPSHGLRVLKRALKVLGSRAIDKRTLLGKALARWRADLVADLGGEAAVSAQGRAVVEWPPDPPRGRAAKTPWRTRCPSGVDRETGEAAVRRQEPGGGVEVIT